MRSIGPDRLERVVAGLVERAERRFFGKYRGLVVDNADPAHLGRLRVRIPSLLGPDVVTGWATPCVPFGGSAAQGLLFIPDAGAGVWVEFEEGDLEFPVWVGTYWSKPSSSSELPVPVEADGSTGSEVQDPPTCKVIQTGLGHTLQFEDDENAAAVTLVDGHNHHVVRLDQTGITITHGGQKNQVLITKDTVTIKQDSTEVLLSSSGVQIGGQAASEAIVHGTTFAQNVTTFINTGFNTHTHTGNLGAPTSPPMVPASLDVPLSSKHKVE
jgi:uncharacterized protein involved in type VI secretion and phage assembly